MGKVEAFVVGLNVSHSLLVEVNGRVKQKQVRGKEERKFSRGEEFDLTLNLSRLTLNAT